MMGEPLTAVEKAARDVVRSKDMCGYIHKSLTAPASVCILAIGHDDGKHEELTFPPIAAEVISREVGDLRTRLRRACELARDGFSRGWDELDKMERLDELDELERALP